MATAAPDLAVEYEYSLKPDLLLDTETRSEWTAAEDLLGFAHRLLDPRRPPGRRLNHASARADDRRADHGRSGDADAAGAPAHGEERIRHLVVVEGARVVGIVTDRDIRLNLPSPATSLSVWEINYLLAQLTVGGRSCRRRSSSSTPIGRSPRPRAS